MKTIIVRNSEKKFIAGKIICVGRNYADHAKELGNEVPDFPIIFLKPSSNIIYSGENVVHPDYSNNLHHEVELVLLIGEDIKNVEVEKAENAIIAYSVGLDMTLRDLQNQFREKGEPWTLAKCFDTSAVITDFINKADVPNILEQEIILSVNGVVRQKSLLNKMIFKPAEIVSFISKKMKLEAGDLIFTGTPEGVSRVLKGNKIEAEITNLIDLKTEIE